jgi:hypothetical protein
MSVNGTPNIGVVSTGGVDFTNINLLKFGETVVNGGIVSGTITPDATAGTIYKYTLVGNIILDSLANAVAGTSMTIMLTQDATGGRALSSTMKYAAGLKILSTPANATDILSLFYDGTTYYAALTKGYM